MFEGFQGLTAAGYVHTAAATVGIAAGAEQVLRPRPDRLHRWLGYLYVGAMTFADLAVMAVYRFTGHFTLFHAAALLNLLLIALALRPLWTTPRPANWLVTHYKFICWSYVGLLAAAATELAIRVHPASTHGLAVAITVAATSLVTGAGAYLIYGRPPRIVAARLRGEG